MRFNRKATIFSFILTILVIWVHAVESDLALADVPSMTGMERVYYGIQRFLGIGLGQVAVPGFFCVSGYLFFRNAGRSGDALNAGNEGSKGQVRDARNACGKGQVRKSRNAHCKGQVGEVGRLRALSGFTLTYRFFLEKWRRRIFSLVIPYLIWNTAYLALYMVLGRAEPAWNTVYEGVFFHGCNPVFWYMEELIKLTFLTPLIYILEYSRLPGMAALTALNIAAGCYLRLPLHIVNEDALFYYALGAYAALHAGGFVEAEEGRGTGDPGTGKAGESAGMYNVSGSDALRLSPDQRHAGSGGFAGGRPAWSVGLIRHMWLKAAAAAALAAAAAAYAVYAGGDAESVTGCTVLMRAAGAAVVFALISAAGNGSFSGYAGIEKRKRGRLDNIMDYNFLVYATHYLAIRLFRAAAGLAPWGSSSIMRIITYLLMPFCCIAAAAAAGGCMRRAAPGLYRIITGGRG